MLRYSQKRKQLQKTDVQLSFQMLAYVRHTGAYKPYAYARVNKTFFDTHDTIKISKF